MEINAVLDRHGLAKSGLWYVLSPENEGPCARVGHACCVLKTSANILKDCPVDNQNSDSLLILGGANPDGAFDDVYVLDFEQYKWYKCEWQGLPKRYEHLAFIPEHASSEIVVFGGAQMDNNLNDVQVLEKGENHLGIVPDSEAVPGTIKEPSMEATLDVSLSTLQATHHDDTGGEREPDAPSNTDTPTTLVHGGNEATLDVSLPTLEASQHDDTESEHKPDAPSTTDTPTTLVHGGNEATLDVSLPTLKASHHDDTEDEHKPDAPSNTDTPTTLVHGGNEATLDVSLPTLEESHHDDTGGEHKPDTPSNTDTLTTLVHGGNEATPDVSLPTLQESHHDDTGGEHKPYAPSNTDTPTTLVHGGNEATLDVSLPTLKTSHHDDTEDEHKPDAPSTTDTPTTLVHGGNEATLDVSLPTLEASQHDDTEGEHKPDAPSNTDTPTTLVLGSNEATGSRFKEVQTVSDVQGELPPVTDDSNEDNKLSTILVHGDAKKILDISHHDEVEIVIVSDRGEIKSSESSDVEVWNDGCPLPSSGPTCSEWQNSADAHSSGAEAISTQVSTTGCLPECEEPRSGCVNIESVMSSEQVSHAPSTSIIEDGTKVAGNEGFPQYQNKVEDAKSWCLSLPSGEAPSRRTCHSAAAVDNRLFIFGGGQSGAEPVQDDKLYVYNAKENQWSQPDVNGVRPKVRHGHVMIAVKNGIYLHGGMAGTEIFGDLWKLTIDDGEMNWSQPTVTGDVPSKRAAHAGCAVDETLYLFGGMNETGALDDLYSLNTESMLWQKIQCEGPPPHCRLDHTMSAVTVSRNVDENEETTVKQTFLVVFGGMDTSGQIFDDCLAFLVKE